MKTRIEIWVDADLPEELDVDQFRLMLENKTWAAVKGYLTEVEIPSVFVQANEVPIPLPSHGTRQDYVDYIRSQRI